ncbi:G-patch domain-containing protein [Colletotrichum graminicola M1.001]|uniref:PinX1-related protein 1 n=1 Tax=Colletotrichum graminicola (strain M1.001 / M2 / FGSC 10212) TaxID=645133 RepID=E3QWP3_COLGM|nr:G-patch domain-containing protein [Colletotrichum graminicola M1.001]EFQ35281.1 G-patch domain-containing protein [Colletotrichum graminicola M1.001]
MGLAQAKTRRKIGKDPNNTKWTKDADSFGQKILRSQGWEPGQYLGAKGAAHAVHHTAANASFIRVALKDDMLGLGFKQARDDRVTGMDVFSDLLGRLNGKSSESIEKERQARATLQGTLYCDTKFGPMRFVRGGWLVGDQVKDEPTAEPKEEDKDDIKMEDVPTVSESSDGKSKKRKAEESSEDESSSEDEKAKKKRRKEEKKAAKKLKAEAEGDDETLISEKKDKKRKSRSSKEDASEDTQDETEKRSKKNKRGKEKKKEKKEAGSDEEESSDDMTTKKKRKGETDAEKAARKEEKRRRKEEKRAKKEASRESTSTPTTSTPTASGTSTPVLRGHHAVRSRWIAQKRMATMDDKALNAIFMVKSQS